MNLIDQNIERKIQNEIIDPINSGDIQVSVKGFEDVLKGMYELIPDNRRISYGRVHTIKVLAKYLFEKMPDKTSAESVFNQTDNWYAKSTALGVLSFYALQDYKMILPYFESAASDENWDIREMAQMFFRKIIKKYPDAMQQHLMQLTKSNNENTRRFVSETMRPVCENKWFQKKPDYSLKVLRNLFKETAAYPRTSVGNNLSDLARHNPELIMQIVGELVESEDKNSYWIAYRACRNLVKIYPDKVMDLLRVNEYEYKKKKYYRK